MKTYYLLPVFCLALAALFFVSCSSDDDNDFPGGTSAKLLPVKISGNNGNINLEYLYTYDENNRLTKYESNNKEKGKTYSTGKHEIIYDSDGRIVKVNETYNDLTNNSSRTNTYLFTYEDGYVKIQDNFYIKELETDGTGKVIKLLQFDANIPDTPFSITDYIYDSKSNMSKSTLMRYYADEEPTNGNINEYTYDGQNGLFKSVNIPNWFITIQMALPNMFFNNLTSNIVTYGDMAKTEDSFYSEETTYAYKYNANGYPVSYTVTSPPSWCGTPPVPDRDTHFAVQYKEAE